MKHADTIIASLLGALVMFVALWLTVNPVSAETVHEYIRLTVERRLDRLDDTLKELRVGQVDLQKGLARVEALLPRTP